MPAFEFSLDDDVYQPGPKAALLAEVGTLLDAIRARDGAPYYEALYHDRHQAYMVPWAFDALVERISAELGGDILDAALEIYEAKGEHS